MASNEDWERGRVKAEAAERARVSASLDAEHSQSTTSTVMTDIRWGCEARDHDAAMRIGGEAPG